MKPTPRPIDEHQCCHHAAAAKAVLADRERELLELKGPCGNTACRLHYAHSGPCRVVSETAMARRPLHPVAGRAVDISPTAALGEYIARYTPTAEASNDD